MSFVPAPEGRLTFSSQGVVPLYIPSSGPRQALIVVPQEDINIINMYAKIAILLAVAAIAHAGVLAPLTVAGPALVRTPSHDSAIIRSERLGGNFAYSTVEGHAYAAVSPVVQNVVAPVAVSYSAHPYTISHPGLIIH